MPEVGPTRSSSVEVTEVHKSPFYSTVEAENVLQSAENQANYHENMAEGCSMQNNIKTQYLCGSSSPQQTMGDQLCSSSCGGGPCEPSSNKLLISLCLDSNSVTTVDVPSNSDKYSGEMSPRVGAQEHPPLTWLQNDVAAVDNGLSASQVNLVGSVSVSNSPVIVHIEPSVQHVTQKSKLDQLAALQEDASKMSGDQNQVGAGQGTSSVECNGEPSTPILGTSCKESGAEAEASVKCKAKNIRNSKQRHRKTPKTVVQSEYTLRSSSGNKKAEGHTIGKDAASETGSKVETASDRRRGRKKKRQMQENSHDEVSMMRKRLRYLLHKMRYAQNLIDAYSSEGWRGQSLEKLKPEKEIERAKMDINCNKLKIRGLFQRLDAMSTEGRFPDSLYDSDGLLDSEDIYCAKCGSKELASNNDIILCDGACDRGFHQLCLEPPLRTEDIPPGDEGWLCPTCDCKVDCIDLLKDSQGAKLSINDSWEKVFPEAVVTAGSAQNDNLGLPSDDSDDNDYDPDGAEDDDCSADESKLSSDESDFSSASEDLVASPNEDHHLGLPSDDSEDDDFDPNNQDADDSMKQEGSSSDFTSASENLANAIDEDETLSKEGASEQYPEWDDSAPSYGKRQVKRLDYRKLYNETYGNAGSSSSDDDDWKDAVEPERMKDEEGMDIDVPKKTNYVHKKRTRKNKEKDVITRKRRKYAPRKCGVASVNGDVTADVGGSGSMVTNNDNTPRKIHQSPNLGGSTSAQTPACASSPKSDSSAGVRKKRTSKKLGESVTQRLHSYFKENHYRDRSTKEKIAKELGLTYKQVDKWFVNARWSFNHSAPVDSTALKGNSARSLRSGAESINQKDNTSSGVIAPGESADHPSGAGNEALQSNHTVAGSGKLEIGENSGQITLSHGSGRGNIRREISVLVQALPRPDVQSSQDRRNKKRY